MSVVDLIIPHNLAAFVIPSVYSKEECEAWIKAAEEQGKFDEALVNVGQGQQALDRDFRHHLRWMTDDADAAEELWSRIKGVVIPKYLKYAPEETAIGLNDRLRVLKYNPGDYFAPHYDGCFERGDTFSMLTVMVYLNDNFEGGETKFLNEYEKEDPRTYVHSPSQGDVIVFEHDAYHEGCVVRAGVKYVVRTDVMFKHDDSDDSEEEEEEEQELAESFDQGCVVKVGEGKYHLNVDVEGVVCTHSDEAGGECHHVDDVDDDFN